MTNNYTSEDKVAIFKTEQILLSADGKRYCLAAIRQVIELLRDGQEIPSIPPLCIICKVCSGHSQLDPLNMHGKDYVRRL